MDRDAPARCAAQMETFVKSVRNAVIVSDFIYSDAGRYDEVTQVYRSGLAQVDRALARACDTVIEVFAGSLIIHKGVLPE